MDKNPNDYKFSVLIPVYYKEIPENLQMAIESGIKQTLMPDEILIVEDGELGNGLEDVVRKFEINYPKLIRVIRLKENIGIGKVRTLGVKNCKYDIIAFMDSDDISRKDRFEQQITFLKEHNDIDMVGSFITEFENNPDNTVSKRIVKLNYEEVYEYAKFRMPVNNCSIMFKKNPVLEVGAYEIPTGFEDYELCGKLLKNGYKIANIPEFLVNMRFDSKTLARRGGLTYFIKYEYPCMKSFLDMGFITRFEFFRNIILKFPLRVMPNFMRKFIYKKYLRM